MIVVLSGYNGRGKTTLATWISTKYNFIEISFASSLKEWCSKKYNLDLVYLEKHKDIIIHDNITFRDILKSEASILKNVFGNDIFAQQVVKQIKTFENKNIVISDMRFEEEMICLESSNIHQNIIYIWVDGSNTSSMFFNKDMTMFKYCIPRTQTLDERFKIIDSILK